MITLRDLASEIYDYLYSKKMKIDRATVTMALFELGYDAANFTERFRRNLSTAIKNINKYKLNA